MNKAFTNNSIISLDSNHHITSDGDNGCVLTFHELREKTNKQGKKEEFLYEGKVYHPRICQSLRYYIDKTQNSSKSLEELAERLEYNTTLLERLDKEFRQYE